jgi:hypothetical protein
MPRPPHPPKKFPVPVGEEGRWTSKPIYTVEKRKCLTLSGIEPREMQKTATDDSAHVLKKMVTWNLI